MVDLIITLVIITIVGGAIGYVCYAKKRGHTCIGCPHAKNCNSGTCKCIEEDM